MNFFEGDSFIEILGNIDPGPFFVISIIPYLLFLYWLKKSDSISKISLWGFRMTLVFVFMTIVFAVIALAMFGDELTNVDHLHGAAEAFLTFSDALILFGLPSTSHSHSP